MDTLAKTPLPLGLMALIMFASLYFPSALVTAKVSVSITGALSGAVLLSLVNSQLGNVGYFDCHRVCFLCLLRLVSPLHRRGPFRRAIAGGRTGVSGGHRRADRPLPVPLSLDF